MRLKTAVLSILVIIASTLVVACGGAGEAKKNTNPPAYCTPGAPGCVVNPSSTSRIYQGQITLTNPTLYRQVVNDWNVCFSNCADWSGRAEMRLEVSGIIIPAPGRAVIRAFNSRTGQNAFLPYSAQIYPILNGFELRAQGSLAGYDSTFSAISNAPNVTVNGQVVSQMRITLTYDGAQFGYADVALVPY